MAERKTDNTYNSVKQSAPIFTSTNSQSDGSSKLKRIAFEHGDKYYTFVLNPEEFSQTEPSRINVTQTKGGAWADDFGAGVPTVFFRGTTGFKNSTNNGGHGFEKFKELRDFIREYYHQGVPGQEIEEELVFHNYTDGEHWVVVPKVFTLMRSVSRPLMYLYEVQLVCMRPAGDPSSEDVESNSEELEYEPEEIEVQTFQDNKFDVYNGSGR